MLKTSKSLLTIFLIVFIDLLGFGIILPLLPYIAEKFFANALQIGLLIATYSFFQFISSPILGRLSDRFGRKKLLIISQLGSAIGFVLLGTAHSLSWLFLSRLIDGLTGGNISIAQAYIADITTKKNRAKGMGLIGAAFGLGFILGPAIGGLLYQISFSAPAFFAAFISLITITATFFFLPETIKQSSTKPPSPYNLKNIFSTLKTYPLGLLIISFFFINLAFSGLQATFALWTEHSFHFTPIKNGYLFALVGLISIIVQLKILPILLTKTTEKNLLKSGVFLLSIGLLSLALVKQPIFIIPSLVLTATGNGLTNPTLQSVASESVSASIYGSILGLLQSGASLGRIIGPIIAGEFFRSVSQSSQFLFSGFLVLTIAFFLHHRLH